MVDDSPDGPDRRGEFQEAMVKVDIDDLSRRLAGDRGISDYDIWRALKSLNDELYGIESRRRPIPIDLVFARAVLRRARQLRATDFRSVR